MGAVWMRVRADLRARRTAWMALMLAIGVGGAVVLTAAAGARRTATAYPRFLEASRAEDVLVNVGPAGDQDQADFAALLREFPQVEAVAPIAPMLLVPPNGSLHTPYHYAAVDHRFGRAVSRPNIVEGRRTRPDEVHAVLVNRAMADAYDLQVGDRVAWRAHSVGEDDSGELLSEDSEPVDLRVVGIAVYPNEVVPTAPHDELPFMYLTPAFFEHYSDRAHVYSFLALRLREGQADFAAFRDELFATLREFDVPPQALPMSTRFERNAQVERAIRPQAIALWAFAGLTAAAMLLVVVQVLARRTLLDADDARELQALGMSSRQLFASSMVRIGAVALGGALIAVVGAVLASPSMPIGPARLAEPDRGIEVNVAILGIGALALMALVVGLGAIPAWRAARVGAARSRAARRAAHDATSRLGRAVAAAGAPAATSLGVRNAVQSGFGRTRVPARSAIVVSGIAISLVVASLTFTHNLNRVADTPRLYGWDWTFKAGIGDVGIDPQRTVAEVERDPAVAAVALANYGSARVDGDAVTAIGIHEGQGAISPTLLEGRAATRDDEIVLGTRTLRRAGKSVGDTVALSDLFGGAGCDECTGLEDRTMRVVGRAVFPELGDAAHTPTNLGEGAATNANVFVYPEQPDEHYTLVLVRLRPGADATAARERLGRVLVPQDFCARDPECVQTAQRPGDISNFTRVRSTTIALSAVLAVFALGLLVHVLLSSVRRRRRDLAVLKTLGFVRRQVAAVSAWQATTTATLALVIGLPLGIAAGTGVWRLFADALGLAPGAPVPAWIFLAVPAVLGLANLVAAVPALLAARTHPADALRTE